jgi:hypothetical protein
MVGIVGILLLGSLAWSAIGAMVSAVGAAGSALATGATPPTLAPVVAVTPATPTLAVETPRPRDTPIPTQVVVADTPLPTETVVIVATPTLTLEATPTTVADGRNPWVLLPLPEPGTKVPPGQVVVEARGRGDAPIKSISLEMDGTALPVALEQRSEAIWRGSASTRVTAGQHNVRASVTDAAGRSGSYRWSFTATAP